MAKNNAHVPYEFIEASCSSGDNTAIPNLAQFFPK
jgi:hypothetical protein